MPPSAASTVKVYVTQGTVFAEGITDDETVTLYTADGTDFHKTVSRNGTAQLNAQGPGVYIVKWQTAL